MYLGPSLLKSVLAAAPVVPAALQPLGSLFSVRVWQWSCSLLCAVTSTEPNRRATSTWTLLPIPWRRASQHVKSTSSANRRRYQHPLCTFEHKPTSHTYEQQTSWGHVRCCRTGPTGGSCICFTFFCMSYVCLTFHCHTQASACDSRSSTYIEAKDLAIGY
jgi:hypothetical protein